MKKQDTTRKQTGFTLIEVMIVVVIVAILAAVGYPSYQKQVMKGRRSDAQQLLLDISNKEQQYLMDARGYSDNFSTLNVSKDGWSCSGTTCSNKYYSVTVSSLDNSATPPTFTITADSTGTQTDDGDLTLDSLGQKTHNGSTGW